MSERSLCGSTSRHTSTVSRLLHTCAVAVASTEPERRQMTAMRKANSMNVNTSAGLCIWARWPGSSTQAMPATV